jgi:hypothetical protein
MRQRSRSIEGYWIFRIGGKDGGKGGKQFVLAGKLLFHRLENSPGRSSTFFDDEVRAKFK